tara:strand:+ start:113 stop:244 length:132 start_codon:yes stop_codon:yes gene_type:complete
MVDMENISKIADPRIRRALTELAQASKPKFPKMAPKPAPKKKK